MAYSVTIKSEESISGLAQFVIARIVIDELPAFHATIVDPNELSRERT